MTESADKTASVPRWVWIAAFAVGVVFLTAVRPVLQHVPEPPPVLGVFPEGVGLDAVGSSVAFGGEGSLRLVSLEPQGGVHELTRTTLRKIGFVMTEMGVAGVELVTLVDAGMLAADKAARRSSQAEQTMNRWTRVGLSSEDFAAVAASVVTICGTEAAAGAGVVLVDRRGRVRGVYDSAGSEVVSELYHRIAHVDRRGGNVDESGPQ